MEMKILNLESLVQFMLFEKTDSMNLVAVFGMSLSYSCGIGRGAGRHQNMSSPPDKPEQFLNYLYPTWFRDRGSSSSPANAFWFSTVTSS